MDSKKLRTLKALTEHLKSEISIANGYQHDVDDRVFRGRMFLDPSDPLPALAILDSPDPDRFPKATGDQDRIDAAVGLEAWVILIQGWVDDDKLNPTDLAFNLLADIDKALAKILQGQDMMKGRQAHPNYMLGGLIEGMTMEPGVCRPPDSISSTAYCWKRVTLQFVSDPNDPYAD